MLFRCRRQFPELGNPSIMVIDQDRVPKRLDGVVSDHCVSGDDNADFTFAPALVEVDESGGGDATGTLWVI
jgi:hypothetical protein